MSKGIKIDHKARTKYPPAPSLDGEIVEGAVDDIGRQIFRLIQVRDLIATAVASLTNGDKTVLRTSDGGEFSDLMQMTLANSSDAAITVTLSDESTNVLKVTIPANDTKNLQFNPPLLQSAKDVAWYLDMGDFTGTTIEAFAEFSREI